MRCVILCSHEAHRMVLAWCSTLSMTCEQVPRRAVPYCAGPIDSTGPAWYDTADSCEQNCALALGSTLCKLHPYIVIELLRMLHVACRSFLFWPVFSSGWQYAFWKLGYFGYSVDLPEQTAVAKLTELYPYRCYVLYYTAKVNYVRRY